MDRVLHAMSVFTHVVRRGSFTAAADSLGITAASASTLVRQLEERLDVMLLQRSTRSMSLTAEGSQYYKHCVAILSEMREMEEHLSGASRLVRGRLSVEVDQEAGSVLLPTLAEFRSLHTQLDLRIEVGGEGERLIDQGIDCAIVIGHLRDSSLQCKRVGSYQAVTVASPAYLRKNGVPRQVANLHDHEFVHYAPRRSGCARHPRFNGEAGTQTLRLAARTVVGDVQTVVNYATRGLGLAQVGLPLVSRLIAAGELVELLAYARPAVLPIVAIYPQRRHVPMSLRAFIEWATSRFETDLPTRSQQASVDANEWNPSREIGHAAAA
ncbi:LysR family transcriptional regulator [Paraburkholderia sp. BL25I1N1]|uniref:LysR family transcriptional regulator n=1 Tax=Paraburkholderia sp. BL25I1N1 TaxID=1938804 RepID=UPI000D063024|nr:LysR family transcriptional regulator [Paraburkholderia sp. BL25I1N1]PRY06165.1 LysR family transcriptional regulator [Paraburkholderia sp. BL25I1N1]